MPSRKFRQNYIGFVSLVLMGTLACFSSVAAGAGNSGVTYQGRILKPDGTALAGANTQFKLQIRTPDSQNCLMYEEVQSQDMRNSNGAFSLTINDGSGSRTDTTSLTLDKIFANHGSLSLDVSTCSSGTGVYSPNVSDGRNLVVLFKDETMATWEPMPATKINFVPFAFEAKQIAGFTPASLVRVAEADGTLDSVSPLSNANYSELLALIGGTSTQYTKAGQLSGVSMPSMTSGQVLGWNGSAWTSTDPLASVQAFAKTALPSCAAGQFLKDNGTNGFVCATQTVGVTGTVTQVDTGTGLTGGPITSTGTLSLATLGSGATGAVKINYDVYGRVTGATTLAESDIPTLTTAGKVSGSAITSGTIGGTTAINTSGNISSSAGTISAPAATLTAIGTQSVQVFETTNSYKVTIKAPASLSANYALTLPTSAGGGGQVLTTDGSGNLSWSTPSGTGISALTGDVAASGSGSVTSTVNSVGGSTAAQIHSAEVLANAATNLNTASQIVKRDGSGNFSAGTITQTSAVTGSVVYKDSGSNSVTVTAPTSVTSSYSMKWPSGVAGTSGQVLTSDTSGNLTWTTPSTTAAPTGSAGGDLLGSTYPNPVVATVGASTAANIHSAELAANAATAANTASKIVSRDGSGNFSANVVTGNGLTLNNAGSLLNIASPIGGAWTMTLPATAGSSGQVLTTNGSGVLSWAAATAASQWTTHGSNISYDGLGYVGIGTTAPLGLLDVEGGVTPYHVAATNINVVAQGSGGDAAGGNLNLSAGGSGASGAAGSVSVTGGSGGYSGGSVILTGGSTNGTAGDITLQGGVSSSAAGGAINVFAGSGQYGGGVNINAGNGYGTTSGAVTITSGTSAGPSGPVTLQTGLAGYNQSGGSISLITAGGNTGGSGGNILLMPGTAGGSGSSVSGNVGIGTTAPGALLDVNGAIKVAGSGSETCDSTHYVGGIRYNSGNIQFCNGSAWSTLGVAGAGITALTGDVTASGSGSVATTVTQVGGVVAANVAAGANLANAATNVNTASTIVKRDASGNFAGAAVTSTSDVFKDSGSNTVTISAPTSVSTSYGLKFPTAPAGSSGQVLASDTSGNLSWYSLPTSSTPSGAATGDLSGTYPAPTVATVGTSTAAQVHSAELAANGATSTNTVSKLVARDSSGNFAANVMTGNGMTLNNSGSLLNIVNPIGGAWTMTLPATAGSSGQVLSTNGSGVLSWAAAGGASQWTTTGSDIYYTAGNVGIGTAAPTNALEIATNQASSALVKISNANTSNSAGFQATNGTGYLNMNVTGTAQTPSNFATISAVGASVLAINTQDAHPITINTNNVERMRFDSTGNVGIGTTTPHSNLEVAGTAAIGVGSYSGNLYYSNSGSSWGGIVRCPNGETYVVSDAGNSCGSLNYSGTATVVVACNSSQNAGGMHVDCGSYAAGGPALSVRSDLSVVMNGGNVGIGTTEPTAKLHLAPGTATAGSSPLKLTNGVLMSSPEDGALEYASSNLYYTIGSTRYTIPLNTAAGNYSSVSSIGNTSGSITMTPMSGNSLIVNATTVSTSPTTGALLVNGGEGVAGAINASGNIAAGGAVIATTNVVTPQIYGSTAASGNIKIDGTSNVTVGNVLLASSGGNVGIGTTAPTVRLELNGASGGTLKIVDTNQGAGKVLTSDTAGNASWQTPSGAGSWVIKSSTYTAAAGDQLMVDTSGGAFTITLPSSPTIGQIVTILDVSGSFSTNNLTIARNGSMIMSLAEDMTVSNSNSSFTLIYSNATYGWRIK